MRPVQCPVLPDGRLRIHLFVRDPKGPAQTPRGTLGMTPLGPAAFGGARGFFACRPGHGRAASEVGTDGVIRLLPHTDDPRAATCPGCLSSQAFLDAMAVYDPANPLLAAEKPKTPREFLERAAAHGDAVAAEILKDYGEDDPAGKAGGK